MSTEQLPLSPAFRKSLEQASKKDPILKKALKIYGYPKGRQGKPEFATLLKIITSQQLSIHSAAAIWQKIQRAGFHVSEAFLTAKEEELRLSGLSRPKIRYGRALAQAIHDGSLDLEAIGALENQEAIKKLTTIPGIGVWTAEIYLLFTLQKTDSFPAGDLVLQKSIQKLYGLEECPNEKQTREIVKKWHPGSGAVALFLWHAYKEQAP